MTPTHPLKKLFITSAILIFLNLNLDVHAALINGNFETGDLTGWTPLDTHGALQQEVISSPSSFAPPLSSYSYKIRPGSQSLDAGISQSVNTIIGGTYSWSIDIAARELQASQFALGTFELFLDGTVVASKTLTNGSSWSSSFSGDYIATDSAVDFQLIFNRPHGSFTANPQWFADNAVFDLVSAPIPSPQTIWLLGIGLLGLLSLRHRECAE